MGRHVSGDVPVLDRLVDDACAAIGAEIDALAVPRLKGVVLGGGYGRGEGGAVEGHLYNDLDFFAVTEDGAPEAESLAAISAALEPVSEKWSEKLGIDVDFTVKTPWRLKHDEERIMVQELVRGFFDVAGRKGEELLAHIERRPAEVIPWSEAARLLMNRGFGLLLADAAAKGLPVPLPADGCGVPGDGEFVARNLNKCILGAGDARLVSRHAYRWSALERADALGGGLYGSALEWKFRPRAEAVCDWETARREWLAACEEVSAAGRREGAFARSLREGARWVVRRHTLGDLSSFGENCVVRVFHRMEKAVRERRHPSRSLIRDWEIFN